jgi:hypothetical protein
MSIALKLTHDEPKLVYLALVHHLGRPGSELDPDTRQAGEHGLRIVKVRLGNELASESAIIELDDVQYRRLLSAVYGSVNELRVHHMRSGEPSTVDRFTETALQLFPALAGDPDVALDLAEAMMMLHRRIQRAVRQVDSAEPSAESPRPRWPFRR